MNNKKIEEMDKEVEEAKKFANEFFKKLKNINDKDFDNYKYVSEALNKFPLFATDEAGRNILHYVFMRGKDDALVAAILAEYSIKDLRNQRDMTGATPMEYIYDDRLNNRKNNNIMWGLFSRFYSDKALKENYQLKNLIINYFYNNGDSEIKDYVIRFFRKEGLLSEKECFKKFGTEATIKSYTYGGLLTKQDVIRIREAYKEYIAEKYQDAYWEGFEKKPKYIMQGVESDNKEFYESIEKVLCEQKRLREEKLKPHLRDERKNKEGKMARETIANVALAAGDPKINELLDDYKI